MCVPGRCCFQVPSSFVEVTNSVTPQFASGRLKQEVGSSHSVCLSIPWCHCFIISNSSSHLYSPTCKSRQWNDQQSSGVDLEIHPTMTTTSFSSQMSQLHQYLMMMMISTARYCRQSITDNDFAVKKQAKMVYID